VNEKIMDSYVSWDAWGLMQQLGVVPSPVEPKAAACPLILFPERKSTPRSPGAPVLFCSVTVSTFSSLPSRRKYTMGEKLCLALDTIYDILITERRRTAPRIGDF